MLFHSINQDIEVVGVKETGTLGCAMTVAVSLGDYANYSEAAKQMVTIKKRIKPIAETQQSMQNGIKCI